MLVEVGLLSKDCHSRVLYRSTYRSTGKSQWYVFRVLQLLCRRGRAGEPTGVDSPGCPGMRCWCGSWTRGTRYTSEFGLPHQHFARLWTIRIRPFAPQRAIRQNTFGRFVL